MGEDILSGKAVYHCWDALKDEGNEMVIDGDRVPVYVKTDNEAISTIALVRNGMLIARHDSMLSTAMKQLRKDFNYLPFTAVINVNQSAPGLFKLVKGAENPHHNMLENGRLLPEQTKALQEFFKCLSTEIEKCLTKITRDTFKVGWFAIPDASDAEAGGGMSAGQARNASSPKRIGQKPQARKKRKPIKRENRKNPGVVNRNSDSVFSSRYTDNGQNWTVKMAIKALQKDADDDEVYFSVRLAEDNDYGKFAKILDITSVECRCNGELISISDAQPTQNLCLGKLSKGESYTLTVEVKKPDDFGKTKAALVPVLGLKRSSTRTPAPQGDSNE